MPWLCRGHGDLDGLVERTRGDVDRSITVVDESALGPDIRADAGRLSDRRRAELLGTAGGQHEQRQGECAHHHGRISRVLKDGELKPFAIPDSPERTLNEVMSAG